MRPTRVPVAPMLFLLALTLTAGAGAAGNEACSSSGKLVGDPQRFARLATASGEPDPARAALDRQPFDLASMEPKYFRALRYEPQYLRLPVTEFLLPEPPANSSERTRAELDGLLELARTKRTPQAVGRGLELAKVYYRPTAKPSDPDWDSLRRNLFFTASGVDNRFDPDRLPKTADMMARVWSDASHYVWALKYRYDRARPYQLEPKLEPLEEPNFPAYPSAHSANSHVAALVLAELVPQHRAALLANAGELAYSRELIGVHYPSDSEAGEQFARQFVGRLLTVPEFRADLEAARKELAAAPASAANTKAGPQSASGGCSRSC